jgi:dephospho-CoA kinase
MRVGLTGGIGSGKSTVAELLRGWGFEVIDADRIAREVVAPGTPALAAIADHFGPGVLTDDGRLDRAALADIVFHDPAQRAVLEGITHPAIHAEIVRREAAATRRDPDAVLVVDHPLIVETGQVDAFDALVVVVATEATRLRRLVAQRGMDPDDVRARMASQATDEERRRAATWVVANDGDRDHLTDAVADVATQVRAVAAGRGQAGLRDASR